MSLLAEQMSERRQRILAVARETIARAGVEGLTMRSVAEAARVTVPTVYNLVGTKDELLAAAIEEQIESFVAKIETFTRDSQPASRVLAVTEACVEELLRLPDYYPALLRFLATSPAASDARRRVEHALREQFDESLVALERAGQLVEWADPAVIGARLRAQLSGISAEWAAGELDANSFRATALFDLALALLGLCRGAGRKQFERVARQTQSQVGAPRRKSRGRGRRAHQVSSAGR